MSTRAPIDEPTPVAGPDTSAEGAQRADVGDTDAGAIPTLFDLLGHSVAAAHATSAATVAQLNVALMAYRLLQLQRDSIGPDAELLEQLLRGAKTGSDALSRLVRRDPRGGGADTGVEPAMPRTFGGQRAAGLQPLATDDSHDSQGG